MAILGAIIVARMDSRRFPGKVLHPVAGRPLLEHVVQRCRRVRAIERRIIIATTSRPVDQPIARFAVAQGLSVFRGEAENVASRLLECARAAGWDGFYRVNGDSPCLDPELLDRAAETFALGEWDLVTNLYPRSFPYGVSVELLRTARYAEAYRRFERAEEREHATAFFYQHPTEFQIANLRNLEPASSSLNPRWSRLTIDVPEDLPAVESWLRAHPEPATCATVA